MSPRPARCGWCGQFTAQPTEVVLVPPGPYSDGSTELACDRCLRLFDAGYDECHEEVADRDGHAEPCDRPAFDLRIDPEFGTPYPVCRAHYRPPFVTGTSNDGNTVATSSSPALPETGE